MQQEQKRPLPTDVIKRLKKVIKPNADFDEVVDTITDVLQVGQSLEAVLGDGFQITDLFALLSVQGNVNEVIRDFQEFADQFVKLDKDTAKAAILEVKNNVGETGKVTTFILRGLWVLANTYSNALTIYEVSQNNVDLFKDLIAGKDVFKTTNVA